MAEEVSIQKDARNRAQNHARDTWIRTRDYIPNVRVEMRRATWPGKQEIYGTTVMVIATTFLLGHYFCACAQVFSPLVQQILHLFLGEVFARPLQESKSAQNRHGTHKP